MKENYQLTTDEIKKEYQLTDFTHGLSTQAVEKRLADEGHNIIEVKPSLDSNGQPIVTELSSTAKENLYADYGTTANSNVAIVPPGIESKILGGNNYQSDYTRQTEIFRNNI